MEGGIEREKTRRSPGLVGLHTLAMMWGTTSSTNGSNTRGEPGQVWVLWCVSVIRIKKMKLNASASVTHTPAGTVTATPAIYLFRRPQAHTQPVIQPFPWLCQTVWPSAFLSLGFAPPFYFSDRCFAHCLRPCAWRSPRRNVRAT